MIKSITYLDVGPEIAGLLDHDDGTLTAVTFTKGRDGARSYICHTHKVTLCSRATWQQIVDSYDICECLRTAGDQLHAPPPADPPPPGLPPDPPTLHKQLWEMVAQRFENGEPHKDTPAKDHGDKP